MRMSSTTTSIVNSEMRTFKEFSFLEYFVATQSWLSTIDY